MPSERRTIEPSTTLPVSWYERPASAWRSSADGATDSDEAEKLV